MSEEIIEGITEAYSQQPDGFRICTQSTDENLFGTKRYSKHEHTECCIKQIVIEKEYIDGDYVKFYVGYDFNGNKKFKYLYDSVNVKYLQSTLPRP